MKRIVILSFCLACIALVACNKQDDKSASNETNLIEFNDIPISVTQGAPIIQAKSNNIDAEYFTLAAEKEDAHYEMYVECYNPDPILTVSNTYTMSGELFSTTYYHNDEIIAEEFSTFSDDFYEGEPLASRRPGEKYSACVKRVHKAMKQATEENNGFECDLISWILPCGTVIALASIVECAKYGNDY